MSSRSSGLDSGHAPCQAMSSNIHVHPFMNPFLANPPQRTNKRQDQTSRTSNIDPGKGRKRDRGESVRRMIIPSDFSNDDRPEGRSTPRSTRAHRERENFETSSTKKKKRNKHRHPFCVSSLVVEGLGTTRQPNWQQIINFPKGVVREEKIKGS